MTDTDRGQRALREYPDEWFEQQRAELGRLQRIEAARTRLAARLVRGEGACEKGHRKGVEHWHHETLLAFVRDALFVAH